MAADLPAAFAERLRADKPSALPSPRDGSFVLYFLRIAFRANNNPSLEVGLRMAAKLDLPLLCLVVLEDSFPDCMRSDCVEPSRHPTDRATAFRLEACKELQVDFAARGTVLLVHVERDGMRRAVAMSLAAKAALVIADETYGVHPHASAISRVASTGAPLWLCDTACTVPSVLLAAGALVGGNAGFLRATRTAREERLQAGWFPPAAPPPPRAPPEALTRPDWAVDLREDGAVERVLAAPSRRDASVGRLSHTRGGPGAALARWSAYVAGGGLKSYASSRNNPLAPDGKGASRMSAYINAGMIDPYRLARDAVAAKADKYLSEFVGFRESAYLWCLRHPSGYMDAAVAVPAWAKRQLDCASTPAAPPLADLEAGRSGDALWDDCQCCLVLSGELHNNVRMAWGKAIPKWHGCVLPRPVSGTTGPVASPPTAAVRLQAALDLLVRLNDKFALDGGAPPSYGGLLWCLGWRDRPQSNGCPTSRPTSVIGRRVRPGDLERKALWRCRGQQMGAALTATAARPRVQPSAPPAPSLPAAEATAEPMPEREIVRAADEMPAAPRRSTAEKRPRAHAEEGAKTTSTRKLSSQSSTHGTLWHFLNRQSAEALPVPGSLQRE